MSFEGDEWAEILDDFLLESTEILEALPNDVLALESAPHDEDILNKVFRSIHTIKGSAGFLGFVNLAKFTHKLEDLLNKLRKFEIKVTPSIIDVILEASDLLRAVLDQIREKKEDQMDVEECSEKIADCLNGEVDVSKTEEIKQSSTMKKSGELPDKGKRAKKQKKSSSNNILKNVENLELQSEKTAPSKKLGEILIEEEIIKPEDLEAALDAQGEKPKLGKVLLEKNMISRSDLNSALKKQKKSEKKEERTIRVDVKRLDDLMNVVGELVLCRNRLIQLQRGMQEVDLPEALSSGIAEAINQMAFNTSELQMGVMTTRMLPISRVFSKFQRLIRELEKQTGKPLNLIIKGEDTELDKTIIEEIGDPLIHLIRNSVDHGIEPPDERIAKGKSGIGIINLSAAHQGNQIVIEIRDDGRGMDIEKIINHAIQNQLMSEEKIRQMSEQEILTLIFLPGFSTADNITDLSGRGVGMDVVKEKITQLKGMIEIITEADKGSTIRLKLPLTLAIIQVLLISVCENVFAVPLTNVVETLRIDQNDLYSIDGKEVIEFRGRIIPVVFLKKVYNLHSNDIFESSKIESPSDEECAGSEKDWTYIVIVGLGEKQRGLVVDHFIEQEEIVIKSLTKFLASVEGFAGCTIMGDGRVSLILDIEHLIKD